MTGPRLIKEEVTPQDSGFYQCRAENRAGATYANITIYAASASVLLHAGEKIVIVEYCKFGNLRHYLLRHRERFINQMNSETGRVDPDICYSPKSPTSASPGFRSASAAFAI
ncbi:hypothetical protein V5799_016058 [Amblyomma americanum]|uniref:Uncharacterized protein n=1 Tax=Amblyomma americanum TaxID=6943 RepID=A0AAQ4EEA0_AMBAM